MKQIFTLLLLTFIASGCGGRNPKNLGLVEFSISNNIDAEGLKFEIYSISGGFNLSLVGEGDLDSNQLDFFKASNNEIMIKIVDGSMYDPVTDTRISFDTDNYFSAVYKINELEDGRTQLNINALTSLQTVLINERSRQMSLGEAIDSVREETNDLFDFDIINTEVGSLSVNAGNLSNDDLYAFALAGFSSLCAKISIDSQLTPGQTFTPIQLVSLLKTDFRDSVINYSNNGVDLEYRDYSFANGFRNDLIDGILHVSLDQTVNSTNLTPVDLLTWIRRLENRDNSIFARSSTSYFNQDIASNSHTILQPAENEFFSEWVNIEVLVNEHDQKVLSWVESSGYPVEMEYVSSGMYRGDFYSNILNDGEYKVYTAIVSSNGQFQVNERIFNIYNQDPIINLSLYYNEGGEEFDFINNVSVTNAFNLKYDIESLVDLVIVDVTIDGVDFNPSNIVAKNGALPISFNAFYQDGSYSLTFHVIDDAGNFSLIQRDIRKNYNIYELSSSFTFQREGTILDTQYKAYEIGDYNNDGYSDVFLHFDRKPKIFLGPDFQVFWNISDDEWFSSADKCDFNGDGFNDIVVGNAEQTALGIIKVFFGPMIADKTFSGSAEYQGSVIPFGNPTYIERAGAVLGCAKLTGSNQDNILHFNANESLHQGVTRLPAELEIITYNEINNSLTLTPSSNFGLLSILYPGGIEGDRYSSFSNSGDLNNDGFEDIYINGWYNPNLTGYASKYVTPFFGGPSFEYSFGENEFTRFKFSGFNNDFGWNTFVPHNVFITNDGNNDGFAEGVHSNIQCYNYNDCPTDYRYFREVESIRNNGVEAYTLNNNLEYFLESRILLDAKAFDFDDNGNKDLVIFDKDRSSLVTSDIRTYGYNFSTSSLRLIFDSPLTIDGRFTPVISDSDQRAIFVAEETYNSSLITIRILRDVIL